MNDQLPDPEPCNGAYLEVAMYAVVDQLGKRLGWILVNDEGRYQAIPTGQSLVWVSPIIRTHPTKERAVAAVLDVQEAP